MNEGRPSLRDIPGELRNKIYAEYFKRAADEQQLLVTIGRGYFMQSCRIPQPTGPSIVKNLPMLTYSSNRSNAARRTALITSCHQIYQEALPLLYQNCRFEVAADGHEDLLEVFHETLSPHARRAVAALRLNLSFPEDFTKSLWETGILVEIQHKGRADFVETFRSQQNVLRFLEQPHVAWDIESPIPSQKSIDSTVSTWLQARSRICALFPDCKVADVRFVDKSGDPRSYVIKSIEFLNIVVENWAMPNDDALKRLATYWDESDRIDIT